LSRGAEAVSAARSSSACICRRRLRSDTTIRAALSP
jgi:hypothetical protein